MQELQVNKSNLNQCRLIDSEFDTGKPAQPGELIVKVDKFGFSANNITYGATGDQLGYWQFFPPAKNNEGQWGLLPVWGFADVVSSGVDEIPVGERLFGYFPPKAYLCMQNVKVGNQRVIDGAPHRAKLPPGYNTYKRVGAEPGYKKSMDNFRMLLWPLHLTSFCIWDSLKDRDWFGAAQVLVISASSKTSIGLGYALADDDQAPTCVGLTSAGNAHWVDNLNIYDRTVSYQDLSQIDATQATVIVDMSGNAELLRQLRSHLGNNMQYCVRVGLTHWEEVSENLGLKEGRSDFFFAPAHIQKRLQDWGPAEFERQSGKFLQQSSAKSADWLKCSQIAGVSALAEIYRDIAGGKISPEQGIVIQL